LAFSPLSLISLHLREEPSPHPLLRSLILLHPQIQTGGAPSFPSAGTVYPLIQTGTKSLLS